MQVPNDIIVEPSTGRMQSNFQGYYQVESIFNNENYWANIQAGKAESNPGCSVSLDFGDITAWMAFKDKEGDRLILRGCRSQFCFKSSIEQARPCRTI